MCLHSCLTLCRSFCVYQIVGATTHGAVALVLVTDQLNPDFYPRVIEILKLGVTALLSENKSPEVVAQCQHMLFRLLDCQGKTQEAIKVCKSMQAVCGRCLALTLGSSIISFFDPSILRLF